MTTLTHLECAQCARRHEAATPIGVCECGGMLLARYDLKTARESWNREWIQNGPTTIWRYAPVLPASRPNMIVSLGEGLTPLVHAARFGASVGATDLWIKDEGANPAGSAAAREFSVAVSMLADAGVKSLSLATSRGDAVALAAYAAQAGIEAQLQLPAGVPRAIELAACAFGARLDAVGGFAMDEFREPYRLEGAKTLGFELAEQLRWSQPEAIVCPADGGILAAAIWKAAVEMDELGWTASRKPRLFVASAAATHPLVDAAVAASGGAFVSVGAEAARNAAYQMASTEGILFSPSGAAAAAVVREIVAQGLVEAARKIVVVNPASGLLYNEFYRVRYPHREGGEADKLGGLITPR